MSKLVDDSSVARCGGCGRWQYLDLMCEVCKVAAAPQLSDCCRCCEAAVERGEDIGHKPGPGACPHPPCDYCQPYARA